MADDGSILLTDLTPEQQQEAAANIQPAPPAGFDPVDAFGPEELAELSINSKGKDFDPIQYGAANPGKLEDPNTVAKLSDTYGLLKQRGFKFKDADLWEATKHAAKIIPAMAKWAGTALELGVVNPAMETGLGMGLLGPLIAKKTKLDPGAQEEFNKIRDKKSAELVASTELGVTGLAELGAKAAGKIGSFFGLTKSPNEQDPKERENDFWSAVGMAQQRDNISRGKGEAVSAVLGGIVSDLEKSGTKVDPAVVGELAMGDPVTFLAFPGGFKVVGASGKALATVASRVEAVSLVTSLRAAQRLAAKTSGAEAKAIRNFERVQAGTSGLAPAFTQPALTEASSLANQASQAAGVAERGMAAASEAVAASPSARFVQGAQNVGQRLAAPLVQAKDTVSDAVSGAVTRATDLALGTGAGVAGAGLKTAEGVGKGIAAFIPPIATPRALRTIYELAGKAGNQQLAVAKNLATGARDAYSPSLRLASDVARGIPTVAAGAGKGFLTLDIPLAAVSSETPADTANMPVFGSFFGAMGRVPSAAGRVVQGQLIAPRAWTSEAALRDYRNFSGLDEANKFTVESANDPAKSQWLAAVRDFLKPTDAQLYWVEDPVMMGDLLRRYKPGMDEAWYEEAVKQRGVTIPMTDDTGTSRKVILLRDANAAPHEAMHPLQDVLGERAMSEIDRLVYDEYSPIWDPLGQNYARQFLGAKGFAEYLQRGENWQEALLDITSGGTEWRNQLTPEQIDNIANLYLSREISAEVGDTILRNTGPELLANSSFPGKLARVLGKTMVGLGSEPFAGVESEGQGIPVRFEPTEAIRKNLQSGVEELKVERRRPDVRNVPPYDAANPKASRRGEGTGAPIESPAAPASPDAAATEARGIAATASDTPIARGRKSPRQILTQLADIISGRGGVKMEYLSAPGEPAGAITSNRTARRAIVEFFREAPKSARALFEKVFFPEGVLQTEGGKIQVLGWAPEVFASNAHKMAKALSESKATDLSPYPIDATTKTFTEQGWRDLFDDTSNFSKNQVGGFTGSGEPLVVPPGVVGRGFTAPEVTGAATPLSQAKADFISALFGIPVPKTPRIGRVFPRNLAGQEVSQATMPGRVSDPVQPRPPFSGARAEELGIAGEQIREVNPFRAELDKRGIKPSLIEAVQRLNLDNIVDVAGAGEVPQFRGNEFTLQAGFQPKAKEPRAIKSAATRFPSGKVYEGKLHSDSLQNGFKAEPEARKINPDEFWAKAEDGFMTNEGEFLGRDAAFQRALELKQITEKQASDESMLSPDSPTGGSLEAVGFEATRQFQPRTFEEGVEHIRNLTPEENARDVALGRGVTEKAFEIAKLVKTPEQLQRLQDERQAISGQMADLKTRLQKSIASGKMDMAVANESMFLALKGQAMREAYEAATNTGSAVGVLENGGKFQPRFRDDQISAESRRLIAKQHRDNAARMEKDRDPIIQRWAKDEIQSALMQERMAQFQPSDDPRSVESAAVQDNRGRLYYGRYHGEAIGNAQIQKAEKIPDYADPSWDVPYRVGYVTRDGEFLSREAAFARAKEIGQLAADTELRTPEEGIHTSEFKGQGAFQPFQPAPNKGVEEVAAGYAKQAGIIYKPSKVFLPVNPTTSKKLADFYESAKSDPKDKEVEASYKALTKETMEQWRAIAAAGYALEPFTGKGEPYKSSDEMMADVRDNKHLYFLKTNPGTITATADNPMLEAAGVKGLELTINDAFRAVHDFFGHAKEGLQFGPRGELNAWMVHSGMYSTAAQGALAAETLAQNSWVNFGKHLRDELNNVIERGAEGYVAPPDRPFAPQKNIIVPGELIQEARAQFQPTSGDYERRRARATLRREEPKAAAPAIIVNFKMTPVPSGFSKAWIMPNGEPVQLGSQWHHDWLNENAKQVNERWNIAIEAAKKSDAEGSREAALKAGFARVNLGFQNGGLTIELRAKDLRKHKNAILDLVNANAPAIDRITVSLLDDAVKKTVDTAQENVFQFSDEEKANHIPFVTGEIEPRSGASFQPRGETEGLPGFDTGREVLTPQLRAQMSRQELRRHFPEAVVPRANNETLPSAILDSPLYKRAGDEQTAVEQFAKRLVDFARENESSPEYQLGKKWYSEFTPMLKKAFGKDAKPMAELLAATSPNTSVDVNFGYAFDALKSWRDGRFSKIIPKFEEGLEKIADESWEKWYAKNGDVKEVDPTPAAFLAAWITKFDLKPKQSNGKLYGQHSIPVLQVLARRWMDLNRGPKTLNFVENLLGKSDEATIDLWSDRSMRWAGYEGFQERWRILPENKAAVSDKDFAFSQKVFRAAADELKMKSSELQAGLWFAEKARWDQNGWSRMDLGDFREEIKKVPLLEKGYEQRLQTQKESMKKTKFEQTEFDVAPRFQ